GGIGAPIDGFLWDAVGGIISFHACPPTGDPFMTSMCPNTGVSADGTVVAGTEGIVLFGPPAGEAFRWTEGSGRVGLGLRPGRPGGVSEANVVDDDGQVLSGLAAFPGAQPQAIYWDSANAPHLLGAFVDGAGGRACATKHDGSVIVRQ